MNRFHPRSPGARLSALRRALWEEDRARERVALIRTGAFPTDWRDRLGALEMTEAARMEAERELWEAMAGHGLD